MRLCFVKENITMATKHAWNKNIEIMVKNGCKIRAVNGYRHLHAHVDRVQDH